MTYEQLKKHLDNFFGDDSRSIADTREGLEAIIADAEGMLAALHEDHPGDLR